MNLRLYFTKSLTPWGVPRVVHRRPAPLGRLSRVRAVGSFINSWRLTAAPIELEVHLNLLKERDPEPWGLARGLEQARKLGLGRRKGVRKNFLDMAWWAG